MRLLNKSSSLHFRLVNGGMRGPREALIAPGLVSEATVSGYHADNIAPALLGGFVLIRYVFPYNSRPLQKMIVLHFSMLLSANGCDSTEALRSRLDNYMI